MLHCPRRTRTHSLPRMCLELFVFAVLACAPPRFPTTVLSDPGRLSGALDVGTAALVDATGATATVDTGRPIIMMIHGRDQAYRSTGSIERQWREAFDDGLRAIRFEMQ